MIIQGELKSMTQKNNNDKSFEDHYEEIEAIVKSKKRKWMLNDLGYISYEDVVQKILIRIYQKWSLYDQSKPLDRWVNRVTLNALQTIYRDEYGYCARPCNGCANNQGNDLCAITESGKQCEECPIYESWIKNKKIGHEIKLPAELEETIHESISNDNIDFNMDKKLNIFHDHMMKILKHPEDKIYQYFYIENKTLEEIRKLLGYVNRPKSIAYIRQVKIRIAEIAKKEVQDEKIDIY